MGISAEDAERVNKTFQKRLEDLVYAQKDNTLPQMDEKTARDLPLFSPVHKSLFAHLEKRGDNAPDWDAASSINSVKKGLIPAYWPQPLLREQQSPDFMRNMQYFVYNDLNGEPFMRSEYSLLPYVLFSPYSPLKLAAERTPLSPHQEGSKPDMFPYCEAFEDLIHETVHGRAAPPSEFGLHFSPYNPLTLRISPSVGMEWIQGLHRSGILQQKEHRSVHDMVYWPNPSSTPRLENARKRVSNAGIPGDTEQDMYEFFSSAPARPLETLGSIFSDAEEYIVKQIKKLESPEGQQAFRELMDSKMAKDLLAMFDEGITGTPPSEPKHRPRPTTESDVEKIAKAVKVKRQWNKPATSSQDTDKVVSTSTTSERHVDEDGSIETTVTVWKRFADGRESTTTTTHFEDSGARKGSQEDGQEVKAEKKPDQSKKGWFWN
jgi:hypothetical protein